MAATNRSLYLGLFVIVLGCLTLVFTPQRLLGGIMAIAGLSMIIWKA